MTPTFTPYRMTSSEYLFALTNPGSETALKLEIQMEQLGWRSSYQRRGFVTFKADAPFSLADLTPPLGCARRLCLSLGKFSTREDATRQIEKTRASEPEIPIHHAHFHERKLQGIPHPHGLLRPAVGQLIGTVVGLSETEFWAGIHRHAPRLSPDPAGDSGIQMAANSPSRAWLKLEEALRFFDLPLRRSDIVVELGCAPGGVVLALLDRGISVIGVDPAKMADVVLQSAISNRHATPNDRPWFYHCRKPAALTSKRDLGHDVTWFMSDMNQSPEIVLKECARFCKMAPSIRGILITLKLTDLAQVTQKHDWFRSLHAMGFRETRLQQLSVHHKEFSLLAM